MQTKADFRQTVSGMVTVDSRHRWISRESDYMAEQGATFFRATHKPGDPSVLELEGWYRQPSIDEMPEPPWGEPFTAKEF